jgi:uncharacterized protein (TIGR02271 family)
MRKAYVLAAGALIGALLLSVINGMWNWGTPLWSALTVGAIAGLGTAAGLDLLIRFNRAGQQETETDSIVNVSAIGTMKLREEQLDIRTERVQLADVEVRRETVTDEQVLTVPVTREELVVWKNGVEAVRIPVREDRVEVRKVPVVLQDVNVYTEHVESEETVEETLKRETARIEVTGEADVWERNPDHL